MILLIVAIAFVILVILYALGNICGATGLLILAMLGAYAVVKTASPFA